MTVYRITLALLATFFIQPAFGQTEMDNRIEAGGKYADGLIERKVDTIAVFSATYFRGKSQDAVCIFWKKDGVTSVYDDRGFETARVDQEHANSMWNYLTTNFESLKKDELKPCSYKTVVKGKVRIETPLMMDADWRKCSLRLNGQKIDYTITSSVITRSSTEYSTGKKLVNINYEYNLNTTRKLFLDKLEDLIP